MDEREYSYIKHKVRHMVGVDLDSYKSPQVQRRLRICLRRSGHRNWPAFFRAIGNDPTAQRQLKDYLTINVSSFFRDTPKFDYLRDSILPGLLNTSPKLRVWSAGCSYGHEPYSLAMLLAEATSIYRRHYILATDIDDSALAFAQTGGPYTAAEAETVSPALRERYFQLQNDGYHVSERLRRNVTFHQHNLLVDSFEERFDLILCRNVVIYFTSEVKAHLYAKFSRALRPGGILFVGGTEIIFKASELELESVGVSFYRRLAITGSQFAHS